jgi:hypothetical protein
VPPRPPRETPAARPAALAAGPARTLRAIPAAGRPPGLPPPPARRRAGPRSPASAGPASHPEGRSGPRRRRRARPWPRRSPSLTDCR